MNKKIVLFCAGGMSTSLLVNRMEEAAKMQNYPCHIDAFSIAQFENKGKDASIILIGPQVRFYLDKIKNKFPDVPVEVINMRDYGKMDGVAILDFIKKVLGDE